MPPLRAHSITPYRPVAGWVAYDGDCGVCQRLVRVVAPYLRRQGFVFETLQAPWMAARLHISYGVAPEDLLKEMRVLTADGRALAGAEAIIFLTRYVWWLWPLWALVQAPGMKPLLRIGYRWLARHRHRISAHLGYRACRLEKPSPPARTRIA
ncbi:MAG TPA: DUF393 domain-containing protein [Terriglobales bacterium]|nr:DUF393 domain-containing protein [Terriglobales bacterium]